MNDHQEARIRELEAALAQKTALLHEIDHRVKNNLQLISSLMLLQSRRMTDEVARQALRTMLERVSAVATMHRRLFQGDDAQQFEVSDFVRDLAGDLALAAGRDDIQITLDLVPVTVPASAAAPLALVLNELIGNALKHAFPAGQGGVIAIRVDLADDLCILTVADDGCGMGEAPKAFGLTIVGLLCQQLRAGLEIAAAEPGVRAVVRAPRQAA
ncbi:MAG: histidine kinase [Phenylobacterium sp.]|nr:histidine kinase [Phenylobacterium sp.]